LGRLRMLAPQRTIVNVVNRLERSQNDRLKLRYVLGPSNAVIAVNEALDSPAFSHSVAICS
jgi:hypothetical protein